MTESIKRVLERFVHRSEKNESLDFSKVAMPFIAKGALHSLEDAQSFGGDVAKYGFWRPHMCAVCCLKMVGDVMHKTDVLSLSALVDKCVESGVYIVDSHKNVKGAFHHPLVHVMEKLGIPAKVAGKIEMEQLVHEVSHGKVVFLSVDLSKLPDSQYDESHLVVVYKYLSPEREFKIHDCASVLSENGNGMLIAEEELSKLSNKKGVIIG